MRENYFDLQKDSIIWIYGAGNIGENYCEKLSKDGYYVVGFLDKNADLGSERCGRKVLSPDEAEKIVSENIVVIMSMRSGVQQEDAAEKLFKTTGLRKIIYLPMQIRQPLSVRRQYRLNYARLVKGDFEHIRQKPMFGYGADHSGYVIIEQGSEDIVFWCDISDLYTLFPIDEDLLKRWQINLNVMKQYVDRKIEEFYPYVELFRYLKGEEACIDSYMEFHGRTTKEQREQLLVDRRMLYQVYEQAYKYELSFFTDSPLICMWSENGYFHVQDGLHRAHYLISKGYTEVPVSVTKSDFEKYIFFKEDKKCKQ